MVCNCIIYGTYNMVSMMMVFIQKFGKPSKKINPKKRKAFVDGGGSYVRGMYHKEYRRTLEG